MPRIPTRCERHVGEPYPPRCAGCDAAQPAEPKRGPSVGVYSSEECLAHEGYYLPCDSCWRADRDGVKTTIPPPV